MNCRNATFREIFQMQNCNLNNLPENYSLRYYLYHYFSDPEMLQVAEIPGKGKICGYVMSKMEDSSSLKGEPPHGHITSVSVLRTHRKLGLATRLMLNAERAMGEIYSSQYVMLHVRESNTAAKHLYKKTLSFNVFQVAKGYYADGEDAYQMRTDTKREIWPHVLKEERQHLEEYLANKKEEENRKLTKNVHAKLNQRLKRK